MLSNYVRNFASVASVCFDAVYELATAGLRMMAVVIERLVLRTLQQEERAWLPGSTFHAEKRIKSKYDPRE